MAIFPASSRARARKNPLRRSPAEETPVPITRNQRDQPAAASSHTPTHASPPDKRPNSLSVFPARPAFSSIANAPFVRDDLGPPPRSPVFLEAALSSRCIRGARAVPPFSAARTRLRPKGLRSRQSLALTRRIYRRSRGSAVSSQRKIIPDSARPGLAPPSSDTLRSLSLSLLRLCWRDSRGFKVFSRTVSRYV